MNKARPVVLKGINKGSKLLVDLLISVFSLSVSLGVVRYRELQFSA
jgi:hypothetical protein